jgi:hypothetical protein
VSFMPTATQNLGVFYPLSPLHACASEIPLDLSIKQTDICE